MTCFEPDHDNAQIMMGDFQKIVVGRLEDMAWLCAEGYRYSQHLDPQKVREMGMLLRQLERACGIHRVAA